MRHEALGLPRSVLQVRIALSWAQLTEIQCAACLGGRGSMLK